MILVILVNLMVLLYLMILVNLLVLANLVIPVVLLILVILLNWAILVNPSILENLINLVIVMHLVILANLVILVSLVISKTLNQLQSPYAKLWPDWSHKSAFINLDKLDQRQKVRKSRFHQQFCTENHRGGPKTEFEGPLVLQNYFGPPTMVAVVTEFEDRVGDSCESGNIC